MLLIGNGNLYTGPAQGRLIQDGAVLIDGQRIADTGTTQSGAR